MKEDTNCQEDQFTNCQTPNKNFKENFGENFGRKFQTNFLSPKSKTKRDRWHIIIIINFWAIAPLYLLKVTKGTKKKKKKFSAQQKKKNSARNREIARRRERLGVLLHRVFNRDLVGVAGLGGRCKLQLKGGGANEFCDVF